MTDFSHTSKKELLKRLLRKENISLLEEIISEYEKIEQTDPAESCVEFDVLKKDFPRIKRNVDDLLDSHDVSSPRILKPLSFALTTTNLVFVVLGKNILESTYHFAFDNKENLSGLLTSFIMNGLPLAFFYRLSFKRAIYDVFFENITISQRYCIPQVLAHEYAHHVQKAMGVPLLSKAFKEGHARGVEKNFDTSSPVSLAHHNQELCLARERILVELYHPGLAFRLSKYSLGTASFAIAEKKYGKEVYAEALKGKNIFV